MAYTLKLFETFLRESNQIAKCEGAIDQTWAEAREQMVEAAHNEILELQEIDKANELRKRGLEPHAKLAEHRAMSAHMARCFALFEAATTFREMMRAAAGSLAISTDTAGTGLEEWQRRLISEVQGNE